MVGLIVFRRLISPSASAVLHGSNGIANGVNVTA
ncbi:hypothetical protein X747_30780 [Mesorhizobium sp. LNJC384A00]|nr:hypothetical protein X747_30780 [Mesorhizobium sp. LNJC384A00]